MIWRPIQPGLQNSIMVHTAQMPPSNRKSWNMTGNTRRRGSDVSNIQLTCRRRLNGLANTWFHLSCPILPSTQDNRSQSALYSVLASIFINFQRYFAILAGLFDSNVLSRHRPASHLQLCAILINMREAKCQSIARIPWWKPKNVFYIRWPTSWRSALTTQRSVNASNTLAPTHLQTPPSNRHVSGSSISRIHARI